MRSSVIQKYKSNPNFTVLVDSIELVRSLLNVMMEEILSIINVIYQLESVCKHSYIMTFHAVLCLFSSVSHRHSAIL